MLCLLKTNGFLLVFYVCDASQNLFVEILSLIDIEAVVEENSILFQITYEHSG
jgi:hypothetical protein